MKLLKHRLLIPCLLATHAGVAADFDSGSTGAYGPINITANTTLDMPADGIFHATTVHVAAGTYLTFNKNENNTPVYILATGDVTIDGTVDVSGGYGSGTAGGAGGPGGFDGGRPGTLGQAAGAGYGPGGGNPGDSADTAGKGQFNIKYSGTFALPADGESYGTKLLMPLIGGSGGGGFPLSGGQGGGGGGGGAILIASNTAIIFGGGYANKIDARGRPASGTYQGSGSGGAIRLVAPKVTGGPGRLNTQWNSHNAYGRIRIDALDRTGFDLDLIPAAASHISAGSRMQVFMEDVPSLAITSAAGTAIASGTTAPVTVMLPTGSPTTQTVTVEATNYGGQLPVQVVLTPLQGERVIYDTVLDMAGANTASVDVSVEIPVEVPVEVHAWTNY